ncbi:hypothetical protein F3Y22_tig00110600pilonHSYRG00099 [Hibiscus syriacus]|uniref:Serine/threonine receptor-like kinase NFP n=1 Tax=Hibiscus syriacus TaxID=106335 RepID=A0A6A3A4V7_HIBSY|nr:serine/threonine receptor-like kinase NFP [Hibiscus syriacus]KAE8698272.1 hypothetical protein F3Y22_tig00110600pilonHSYRG00099 [Hibiscus syriacus]
MRTKPDPIPVSLFYCLPFFFFFFHGNSQLPPNITGYTCSPNQTTYPCQTYVSYRPNAPDFLDLASIADLFNLSRLMISEPSNISTPSAPLVPNQLLFVPVSCACNSINATVGSLSAARLTYTIQRGDTFYRVSSLNFQNLTTYQSVEAFNPDAVPTQLDIGDRIVFPIFCKCPNETQIRNGVNYLVTYVFQPFDDLSAVASRFGVRRQDIIDINGDNIQLSDTIFIPVNRLPVLSQPEPAPAGSPGRTERTGVIVGLSVGLGTCGILMILFLFVLVYREVLSNKRAKERDEENQRLKMNKPGMGMKGTEANLMADVSDCLDKYRVFKVDELKEATDFFSDSCLIQGSVYKGSIDGDAYAIKKMKWNACEELKILQKVNHGNLVKLEGFCIDPEDTNCYLVYEFIENGSLFSWLHENETEKLNWKTRLRIAIDVANGLQYIHEHTRPRVVHKDIKTSNILLDSNMRAKIANFGLAKSGCNAITMHIVGTQGYIAPEYLADGVVSTRMDVFSFGVVLLELVSGREAIDDDGKLLWASVEGILDGNEERKVRKVKEFMDGSLLEQSLSMEGVINVMAVAVSCLNKDPTKRPSMVDIVYTLSRSDDLIFDESEDNLSAPPVVAR